jgi:hypothetical protein
VENRELLKVVEEMMVKIEAEIDANRKADQKHIKEIMKHSLVLQPPNWMPGEKRYRPTEKLGRPWI